MKKKILIVDDEPDLRHLLRWFFKGKDYLVLEAGDGEEALKVVKKDRPDLILLDIMMPGMDGWEVSRRIKENKELQDIPISMLSIKSEPEDVNRSMTYAHADSHISKPIDFYMLNKTVSKFAGAKGKDPEEPGRLGPTRKVPSDLLSPDSDNN